MRRSALSNSFLHSQTTRLPYICSSCRRRALQPRSTPSSLLRTASSGLPLTERLRRKIWGSDNPPGLKDPYGGPGFLERRRAAKEDEKQAEQNALSQVPSEEVNVYADNELPDQYVQRDDSIAPSVTVLEDPLKEPRYVSAQTWDGLQHLGSTGRWTEAPLRPIDNFQPFLGTFKPATTTEEIICSLHQATVEAVVLHELGPTLLQQIGDITCTPGASSLYEQTTLGMNQAGNHIVLKHIDAGHESVTQAIKDAVGQNISPHTSVTGASQDRSSVDDAEPRGPYDEITRAARPPGSMNEAEPEEEVSGEVDVETQTFQVYPVKSLEFLKLQFPSAELRFAIIKRVSQLSGRRLPDPVVTSSETLLPIYEYLLKDISPRPKKVADQVIANHDIVNFRNISIMSTRETPVHKDKRLGRWKVIAAELESKGLPPVGTRL